MKVASVTKIGIVSILLVSAQSVITFHLAIAEQSKSVHSSRRPAVKGQKAVGLEAIEPKENKEREESDWTGSYVGVNAGAAFGATSGRNVLLLLGTSSRE